jgi:FkbH-like protein
VKLIEALELLKRPVPEGASPFKACLACGFTPLHLETFLAAHLRLLYPEARIEITTGPYGDLAGTLESITPAGLEAVAVAVEWADLDPRLGIRALGGWRAADASDIVGSARKAALRIGGILGKLASSVPVCVCFPTLPLPPLFIDRPEQCGIHELELREIVASLASTAAGERGVRVVNHQLLEEISPSGERFDIGSELATGFPWTISHASRVAELMAAIIRNPVPKKGLITDLDDTLWAGILGEVGVENLAWDMDRQAQTHGLYQQLLASLASAGILIGVASKNDPDLVEKAFARPDLLLPRENVFPFEVHWDRKSGSVRRILETWNVGPETVVFIDDSPMELAEVDAAFPAMECLLFPKNDPKAFWELLKHLRRIFGKSAVTDEDLLRLRSIRTASPFRSRSSDAVGSQDDFLREAEAGILFTMGKGPADARALELVNKTNQFNLNGRRWTDAAWAAHFRRPEAFLLTATYEDKFGPLGKIAALLGRRDGRSLVIDAWVMSCRAFSRRIEHQCLKYLFDKTGVEEIIFDFVITPRNGPLREFFGPWLSGPPSEPFSLSKGSFFEKLPALFHEITEDADG